MSVSYLRRFHSVTSFIMLNNMLYIINGHVKGKASLIMVIVIVIISISVYCLTSGASILYPLSTRLTTSTIMLRVKQVYS